LGKISLDKYSCWFFNFSLVFISYIGFDNGVFKRVLNDRYVTFDYHSKLSGGEGVHMRFLPGMKKLKSISFGGLRIPELSCKQPVIS